MNFGFKDKMQSLERNADQIFIDSGFSTVAYDIAATDRIFGVGTYACDNQIENDVECVSIQGALFQGIQQKMNAITQQGGSLTDGNWDLVCSEKRLLSEHKIRIMQRWFPDRYRKLMIDELPVLIEAQTAEKLAICRLYPPPEVDLREPDSLLIKKTVFNDVFVDAFGVMGFKKKRLIRGVVVLKKELSNGLEMVVETDPILLMQPSVGLILSSGSGSLIKQLPRYSGMALDYLTYLSVSDLGVSRRLHTFAFSGFSFARNICRRYADSSTLEVALRAHALWYRSMVMPFEESLAAAWRQSTELNPTTLRN